MGINVRCDNCGKLVEVDPESGRRRRVRCPACGARLSMPAGLAELPRPHIPASALPAWRLKPRAGRAGRIPRRRAGAGTAGG